MNVYFKDEASDTLLKAFDTELKMQSMFSSYKFVDKEQAAKTMKTLLARF